MMNDERIDWEAAGGDVGIEISLSLSSYPDSSSSTTSPSEKAAPATSEALEELEAPAVQPQPEATKDVVPETREDEETSPNRLPFLVEEPELTFPEEEQAAKLVVEEPTAVAELAQVSETREEVEHTSTPEPEQPQIEKPKQQPVVSEPEQALTSQPETAEPSPELPQDTEIMPPAPFVQPTSPSLGDEAGMEAMWVEELVTPSPTSEAEVVTTTKSKPRRGTNFFSQARLFKRSAKEEKQPAAVPKPKKLHTSVKLLGDEEEPQLQTLPSQKMSRKKEGRGPNVRVQVQTGTRRASAASSAAAAISAPRQPPKAKKISRQIAQKATNARELLAMALHPETDTEKKQGLAQAAFGEATKARLLMEGNSPPKGLNLVLRAASHKGRSAVLAASLCPDNQDQVSRAKHYMDLILPVKTFPAVSTDHVAPVKGDCSVSKASEADLSSLGFCSPRPVPGADLTAPQAKDVTSPISMSSLNEILDGPAQMSHVSPAKKKSGVQNMPTQGMHYREMPPPDDAASMDDQGSWTDGSYEEGRTPAAEAHSPKMSGEKKSRKKKRVFRFARMAGLRGHGGSTNNAKSPADKLGWLRRKSEGDSETASIPVVDMTPPPNVPYQSKPYQRFEASVQADSSSRRSGNTKELSTVVRRTHQVDKETQDRLQAALLSDETEQLLSFDGVRMFGQNIKEEENEDDEEIFDPLEEGVEAGEFLTKRAVKVEPQFVAAPAGRASYLTAKSWDSLVEGGAARLADAPKAIVQALLSNETEDEDIPPPYPSPQDSQPPLYMPSASPMSVESRVPGLTDKYSSAEEPALEDKYSTEEPVSDDAVVSPSSASSSPSYAEESPRKQRRGAALFSRMQPRRKSRETRDEEEDFQGESLPEERKHLEAEAKATETPIPSESARRNVEEPKPLETPKSTNKDQKTGLKMKIIQKFQRKKKIREGEFNNDDEAEEEREQQENFPVEEIQYKEVYYGDLGPQATGTTTLTSVDHGNVPIVKVEGNILQEMETKPTTSTEESDPLIRNIKQQARKTSKRGKDPMTRNEVYVARGIDP